MARQAAMAARADSTIAVHTPTVSTAPKEPSVKLNSNKAGRGGARLSSRQLIAAHITRMGYSIIVVVAGVALVAYFIFATEAPLVSKAAVFGLFAFSFAGIFWIRGWSLVGMFLLVALGIFIVCYRACQQARGSDR